MTSNFLEFVVSYRHERRVDVGSYLPFPNYRENGTKILYKTHDRKGERRRGCGTGYVFKVLLLSASTTILSLHFLPVVRESAMCFPF